MVGKREDQQMILHGDSSSLVSPLGREFQMVRLLGMTENDAIEAIVVFKLGEHSEVQPCSIHLGYGGQMVSRSGNAEHSTSMHRSASLSNG